MSNVALKLSGVDRVLDFLRVADLFGGVTDEQRRHADKHRDRYLKLALPGRKR